MNIIKAQKAIEVNFLKSISHEEINDILREFKEKLDKSNALLKKINEGDSSYLNGFEIFEEIDNVLELTGGDHE